ncbi:MAG: hypothetical protein R3F37_04065 [Candidatus Competibacteraceae bacterium]
MKRLARTQFCFSKSIEMRDTVNGLFTNWFGQFASLGNENAKWR